MICLKCNGTGKIKFSYTQRSRLVASTQMATVIDGYLYWTDCSSLVWLNRTQHPRERSELIVEHRHGWCVGGYVVGRSGEKIADKFKGPN